MIKAVTWRVMSFSGTSFILWLWSRSTFESLFYAFIISAGAIFLYYAHERIWDRVEWGRRDV